MRHCATPASKAMRELGPLTGLDPCFAAITVGQRNGHATASITLKLAGTAFDLARSASQNSGKASSVCTRKYRKGCAKAQLCTHDPVGQARAQGCAYALQGHHQAQRGVEAAAALGVALHQQGCGHAQCAGGQAVEDLHRDVVPCAGERIGQKAAQRQHQNGRVNKPRDIEAPAARHPQRHRHHGGLGDHDGDAGPQQGCGIGHRCRQALVEQRQHGGIAQVEHGQVSASTTAHGFFSSARMPDCVRVRPLHAWVAQIES
ncbi:hypothetical protein FQA39_LY19381 [Lamprigera yunnana]|nr:hypothetical protein FQA39_LY19381 [Lamprigera yunnana]